jgi:hypothetical protein
MKVEMPIFCLLCCMIIPEITHLSNEDLINELQQRKGLMPVSINLEEELVTWLDVGSYHFYEGFFRKSIQILSLLQKEMVSFTTELNILEDDRVTGDHIYPSGFIFHAGHCRSTALAKSLARSRENLVLSEVAPLSQVLPLFKTYTASSKRIYRNLVLVLCRHRIETHSHAFIKFTSHNIHFFDLIHATFPDVPAIFLSRNPAEIVSSFRKAPPGWLKDGDDLEEIVSGFLARAQHIDPEQLRSIDHLEITPEKLDLVLDYFKVYPVAAELDLMKSQFDYDSKVEFNRKKFVK